MNIIGNAIKFTSKGEVIVRADCRRLDASSVEVNFKIIDTGIGIAPEILNTIFAKFTQADSSITRKYGGTGLGLAICKTLVDIMGGSISVESEQGRGTNFSISLPFNIAEETARADDTKLTTSFKFHEKLHLHVLLVEDNEANILVAETLLESLGCSCKVARNGKIALTLMETQRFDVVLMDIQMPEMDGYSAALRIRELEHERGARRIPIIAMTAHASPGDRDKCIAAGMDSHISKPFTVEDLYGVLRNIESRN